MRIAFLGSLIFSITARCQGDTADTQAVCVGDCIKSLAENGLLTNGLNGICATPQLQKAHFQCLINSCNSESYGSAVKYSISICSAAGANIIPLHPIEVRQTQTHEHGPPDGQVRDRRSVTMIQDLHLPRNVATGLTCNTGVDGLVTVSLGPSQPSATPSTFEEEDARKQSSRATPHNMLTAILPHEDATQFVDGAILMGEFQDASTSTSTTTTCESSTYRINADSTTSSTLSQTTPCSSEEGGIEQMPTSTIPSSLDGQTRSSATSMGSQSWSPTASSTTWKMSSCQESSSMTSSYSTSASYMEAAMSTRTSVQSISQTSGCPSSTTESVKALTLASSTRESSYSSSLRRTRSTSTISSSAITSDPGCSSFSRYSDQMISPTSTTSSWSSYSSESCTDKSPSSSSSLTSTTTTTSTASTEPCFSSSRESTYLNQLYTGCSTFSYASSSYTTSNTLSTTWSSSTYATRTASISDMMASPAAYTLITPSLPPAYVPELEEYGYGTPPPAYDFSRAVGAVFSSSSLPSTTSRTMSSSSSAITSSTWQSRTTSGPAAYGSTTTSATTLTQMTRLASFQVASDAHEDSVENAEVVKVTLISSVAGEFQTTVVTIEQGGAAAASTDAPYQLALNDATSKDDGSKDGSSFAGTGAGDVNQNAESGEGAAFSTETPLPAMLVAAGASSRPTDSVTLILAGTMVVLLCWAL
ncbi:hypothetical protein E4U21_003019 [Claviceps maximensis]|nr:hypothetical protein E4U21_003019 [Claviceps maximensis]